MERVTWNTADRTQTDADADADADAPSQVREEHEFRTDPDRLESRGPGSMVQYSSRRVSVPDCPA